MGGKLNNEDNHLPYHENTPSHKNAHSDKYRHSDEFQEEYYMHPIADKLIQITEHVISATTTSPTPPPLQCDLFHGGVKVCSLHGIWDGVLHPEPNAFPLNLTMTQRTPLTYLTNNLLSAGYGAFKLFLAYLWPRDNEKDRAAFNTFLLYLLEKNRAGVVEVDNGTKMYLLPPCDTTYCVYGTKSKGSLYVVVVGGKKGVKIQ